MSPESNHDASPGPMGNCFPADEQTVPLPVQERIDRVCLAFEDAWQEGRQAEIAQHLGDRPEPERSALLYELLRVDLDYRFSRGDVPTPQEYRARFPEDAALIDSAFSESQRAGHARPTEASTQSRTWEPRSEDAAADTLPPGAKLGRFEIIELLGHGAFGAVYRARDPRLERDVALKIPRAGVLEEKDLARFLREARSAATLRHPHICPVYEVEEGGGVPFIVMAFIEGKTLAAVLRSSKRIEQRGAATAVYKVAMALHEAHQKQIVHRDLKPSNIMIDQRGEPVVMDFGLARRSHAEDLELTRDGQILGTPAYMPPEQARGNVDAVGPASDVYSVGVILYELICGRRPFEGSAGELLTQILRDEPSPPGSYRPDVDPALEAICLKAMAKKVADRYATMAEMAAALKEYLKGTSDMAAREAAPGRSGRGAPEAEAAQPAAVSISVTPARRRGTGRRGPPAWKWVAGAAAGFLAVLLAVVLLVPTKYGTIRIEIDDPDVEVSIDDGKVAVKDLGEPIELTATEHHLVVKRGNLVVRSQRFSVRRGENEALRVTLLPQKEADDDSRNAPVAQAAQALTGDEPVGEVRRFVGHTDRVIGVAFSPDGRFALSGSYDKTIRLWELATGQQIKQLSILRWNPEYGESSTGRIGHVGFSPNGRLGVATGTTDIVYVWDIWREDLLWKLIHPVRGSFRTAFSDDGRHLFTAGHDNIVRKWDIETGKVMWESAVSPGAAGRKHLTRGRFLLTEGTDHVLQIWDFQEGIKIQEFVGHTKHIQSATFSADMNRVLSGGDEKTARLWDVETGRQLRLLEGHTDPIYSVAFSPDGHRALSSSGAEVKGGLFGQSRERTIRLWDLETGQQIRQFKGHDSHIHEVVFSPDGRYALSASSDKTVRLWRLLDTKETQGRQ